MYKRTWVNKLDDIIYLIGGYKAHNIFVRILRFIRNI